MAKRKTRVVYRKAKSRGHRDTGMKIPLAIVAGFAPLGYDIYNGAKASGFNGALENATSDLTGYDIPGKTWNFGDLVKGWTPIVAGFVAHKIASAFGINRALGRAHVPLFRI